MKKLLAATLFALLTTGGKMPTQPEQTQSQQSAQAVTKDSPIVKITPILFVDAIEPALPFWIDRLGFTQVAEVPEGNKIGFVMLTKGSVEIMLQTISSAKSDVTALAQYVRSTCGIYIEVSDFNDLLKRVEGYPVMSPTRDTFYGMREISIKEPGGNVVTFAAPIKK